MLWLYYIIVQKYACNYQFDCNVDDGEENDNAFVPIIFAGIILNICIEMKSEFGPALWLKIWGLVKYCEERVILQLLKGGQKLRKTP